MKISENVCKPLIAVLLVGASSIVGCAHDSVAYLDREKGFLTRMYGDLDALRADVYAWAQTGAKVPFERRNRDASLKELESSLGRVDADLVFRLGLHTRELFFVDRTAGPRFYGCQTNMFLDVTTPKNYAEGTAWLIGLQAAAPAKALIVVSTVAPKHTTIFSIDEFLHTNLIYDPIRRSNPLFGTPGVDYVCGIELLNENDILLHEGWLPGMSQVSLKPRSRLIDLRKLAVAPAVPHNEGNR